MLEIFLEEMKYLELIEIQGDMPYYKPIKTELLKYKEDLYQEETESLKALKQYIVRYVKGDQIGILRERGFLKNGDTVVNTGSTPVSLHLPTNVLKITKVTD